MSKIRKPHELSVQTTIKALIYGQPGSGKSTLALSAPNPVLLDFDNGVHRISPLHQVDTLQIESWQDVLDCEADGSLKPYQTIVIDTAGKMLDYLGAFLIAKNPKLGKSNGALSLQGYGERKGEFSAFLKRLSIMGKHIVFVAHEKEEKEADSKYIRPEVGGSSGTDLFKELDLIGYMEMIGSKRTISFNPTEKYYAKNACGLNETIELPILKEADSNKFFTNSVVNVYQKALADRKEKISDYTALIDVVEGKVESIVDAETANEVSLWAKSYDGHIWSSLLVAAQKINAKAKEIGLKLNTKTKQYESTNEPATA